MDETTAKFMESTLRNIRSALDERLTLHEKQLMRRLIKLSYTAQIGELSPVMREEFELKLSELAEHLSSIDENSSNCIKTAVNYIK